jgi:hypothetical protein
MFESLTIHDMPTRTLGALRTVVSWISHRRRAGLFGGIVLWVAAGITTR